jgi:phage terminase small subunit
MKQPEPPTHLADATRKWWAYVAKTHVLEPHHERLLTAAGEAWDRCEEARDALADAGTYYVDRFGQPRAHPAVAVERDSRIAFARLVRELDLDADPPKAS